MRRVIQTAVLLSRITAIATAPYQKKWSKFDLEELEDQWNRVEEGDDGYDSDDEVSADDKIYIESERREKEAMEKLQSFIDSGTYRPGDQKFEKLAKEAQHAGKAAMIFAKLCMDGERYNEKESIQAGDNLTREWSWDELAEVCNEWKDRLRFGMIEITCFPQEPDSVLVTVQQGWDGQEVYDFLSKEDTIEELTWNDEKSWPSKRNKDDF